MRAYYPCLLVALLIAATVRAQPASVRRAYDKFNRQHVFPGMNANNCNGAIESRGIYDSGLNCKYTNTFIRAQPETVRAVCGVKRRGWLMKTSNEPFDIVVCSLNVTNRNGNTRPCRYTRSIRTSYIVIKCREGYPVHYERHRD